MKRWLSLVSLIALACAAGWFALGRAGHAQAPAGQRGPNERFYEVMQKLDPGGSFYIYGDLKGSIKDCMARVRPVFARPGMPPQAMQCFAAADKVLDQLGLYGLSDFGASVIPDGDLNRTKIYLRAPEGRQKGFLTVLGGQAHPFAILDRVSASALLCLSGDFDGVALMKLVREVVTDVAGTQGNEKLDQGIAQLKQQTGLDVEAINASLGGECAFLLDQDASSKLTIPAGNPPIQIDTPRLALMIKVKDATLYDALKSLAQKKGLPPTSETTDGKLKIFQLPAPPNPFWAVAPAFASDGEFLYISTHIPFIKQLATPAGSLLRDTDEFKRYMTNMPTEGNGLAYASPRIGTVMADVAQKIEDALAREGRKADPGQQIFIDGLKRGAAEAGGLTIRVNLPDGVMSVSRSKAGASQIAAAALAAPAAILVAVAVPNFLEARQRSMAARAKTDKISKVRADQRTMAIALETYYLDQNSYPAWTTESGIKAFGQASPADQPSFRIKRDPSDKLATLTTPIAYIPEYFKDPFSPEGQATFSYWTPSQGTGYILWSPGPDGKYDLNKDNISRLYNPTVMVPSSELLGLTYDPSNGTRSEGDIWRVKQ